MDRYNAINPAHKDSAASGTTVEQPKEPQTVFEQHLREVRQLGPVYSHSGLYDITEQDDRLIQAASGAALDRGPPPKAITIEMYDRRLRKLAELLKQSGHRLLSSITTRCSSAPRSYCQKTRSSSLRYQW
ncbi:hypothetical protein [Bradyrhizobium sp. CCBAU 11434]|uniref:hypothetical protein n=1 Tax=Bradyrhizobium sp. CCBAU 11434 TaxID=1630885 RepID=UPI002305E35D|nr:hypothetical protein [Bradyrhizobium sp. CCBAU 11434]